MGLLTLEVFDAVHIDQKTSIVTAELAVFEAEKAAAFERGVQEGIAQGQGCVIEELTAGRTLLRSWQDGNHAIAQEARAQLLKSLQPLLEGIVASVLPVAARASLVPLAVESILDMAGGALPDRFTIQMNPEDFAEVSRFYPSPENQEFKLVENEAISAGQYALLFEDREGLLDIPRLQQELLNLIRAFFSLDGTRGHDG